MTTVTRFPRQNDAGLRALNVFLRENLVLVVVLVLESEGPYYIYIVLPCTESWVCIPVTQTRSRKWCLNVLTSANGQTF